MRTRGPGALLALADQALVSGASFATTVLLVRRLGLADFGLYGLLWLGVLLALGLQQALVFDGPREFRQGFVVELAAGLIGAGADVGDPDVRARAGLHRPFRGLAAVRQQRVEASTQS